MKKYTPLPSDTASTVFAAMQRKMLEVAFHHTNEVIAANIMNRAFPRYSESWLKSYTTARRRAKLERKNGH